ncbi:MAG: hypothetical protein K0R34_1945 [Herbinix sp.]|jgi:DNA-binding ferritin-like protein (Dps family)|nr:hypothetical protein [Herbinix sp.]
MSYYNNDEYRNAKKTLREEYAVEYDKCEAYIHSMRSEGKIEDHCLLQILDDFLSAQADGKSINSVTGPDLRNYCDNILKAERYRIRNKSLYFLQWILIIPLIISLMIFIRSFLYTKPGHFLENVNNLYIEGYELYYLLIFLTGLLLKNQISKVLFHQSRLHRRVERVIYAIIVGSSCLISILLSDLFPIYIPITLPVYITVSILTLIVLIACWIHNRKAKSLRGNMNIEYDESV